MPARDDLEFITLEDFSPGIYDDWQGAGGASPAPLGAAQLTGTVGCVSSPAGGLMAAPKRVNRLLQSVIDARVDATSYPSDDAKMRITSFRALSPVWDRTGKGVAEVGTPNPYPDNLFFGFEWYFKGVTNYVHKQRVRLYKMFLQSAADPAEGAVTTYDIISNATTTEFTTPFNFGYTSIDLSRDNYSGPTTPGVAIAACMAMSNRDVLTRGYKSFPDSATAAGADSVKTMTGLEQAGGFAGYALFGHQDRVVLLDRSVNYGHSTNGEVPTDMLCATAVNDILTTGVSLECFVAENPGLMGAWASINASEAFFVKQQRGGFVMRGDIAYPTVVRLPSLTPTFDCVNIPCVAPDGRVVYGSREGVFAWDGGETSKHISSQLNGFFWNTGETSAFLHTKGSFAPFNGYVAAPNNFLWDSNTGGWWRLADPTTVPYTFYDVSAAGYLIGVPAYVSASRKILADYYDFSLGQTTFTWRSQPLRATRGRVSRFREIDVLISGVGTVNVKITGINGASDNVTFSVNSATPVAQSLNISVQAHDAYVDITSTATSSSDPAPRVWRVALGRDPQLMTARS